MADMSAQLLVLLIVITSMIYSAHNSSPGQCWSEIDARTGRCNSLLSLDTTREECCAAGSGSSGSGGGVGGGAFAAFSSRDFKPGELFFFRAFRGGVPCEPCQTSCEGVRCGAGKRCKSQDGRSPRCVCDPVCSRKKRKLGPVCGTDGRTYRHVCRLMKKKCTSSDPRLSVAYRGECKAGKCNESLGLMFEGQWICIES